MTTDDRFAALRARYEKLRSQYGLNFILVLSADEARALLDAAEERDVANAALFHVQEAAKHYLADKERAEAERDSAIKQVGETSRQLGACEAERDRLAAALRRMLHSYHNTVSATEFDAITAEARAALAGMEL